MTRQMFALPQATDADAPIRPFSEALETLRTPLWLALGQNIQAANGAARKLGISGRQLPKPGRTATIEAATGLLILTSTAAPEHGDGVCLIEAQSAPRRRPDVTDGVKAVFNRAPEGAAIVGRDGCIHWTNRAYDDVTGRPGTEDVGASLFLTFAADQESANAMRETLVFGRPAEFVAEADSGAVSLRFLPLEDDLGRAPAHLVLIHDEAAAQAAAAMSVRLTNNELHLKALEDLVPGVLFQLERSARGRHSFSHVGQRCFEVMGVSADDLEDRVDRLFDVINGEDLRALKNALEESRASLTPLSWTGRTSPREGQMKWIQITARAEAQADAGVRWHGMISDISHQKEMQQRVESHERLASVGELAAGVAHEINNPLAYVIANLRAVVDDLEGIEASGTFEKRAMAAILIALREAEGGADRVHQIVRDLKQLSRPAAGNVAAVDIEAIVSSSSSMAMSHIRHVARLELDIQPNRYALGNEARLTQVILNLLVNAAQAIPPGAADDNYVRVRAFSDDENVVIEVSDTGVGIPDDVLSKIYEPFFTTKSDRGGTGLGLSMVHNIVREHGGRLEVDNHRKRGACFRVILAVAPIEMPKPKSHHELRRTRSMRRIDLAASADNAESAVATPTRKKRLLLVDDEPALVRALARQLRNYDVTTAAGGRAALEKFVAGDCYDVVLCDLMMPDCTGMQLYREATEIDDKIAGRFVFMTGGVFTDDARQFLAETQAPVLEKPFESDAVKNAVLKIIDDHRVVADQETIA